MMISRSSLMMSASHVHHLNESIWFGDLNPLKLEVSPEIMNNISIAYKISTEYHQAEVSQFRPPSKVGKTEVH